MESDGTHQPGLTPQQAQALNTRDASVALSAGAGCGKTFVLTERYLSHLAPDENAPQGGDGESASQRLAQLVAITFTDRAAREMRDRIRQKCRQRSVSAKDEPVAAYWMEVLRDLESARVSTIHAFCGSLLRAHAVEAGLDPHFRTLQQNESATLLTETIDDELRRLLAERDPAAIDLAVLLGLDSLKEMVQQLVYQRVQAGFQEWRQRSVEQVLNCWEEHFRQKFLPELTAHFAADPAVQRLIETLRENTPDNKVMQGRRAVLLELLPKLATTKNPARDLGTVREEAKVQGGGSKKVWANDDVYNSVKDDCQRLRGNIDKIKHLFAFSREEAAPAAAAGLQLLQIACQVVQTYQQRKREAGGLDFDDLLILARDLLTAPQNESLRKAVAGQIDALLVDEFQDTDPLQVDLVRALCGDRLTTGKLFFVGDFKQSIYRFRRADPGVFRSLREQLPPQGRLPLTRNFRSQKAILDFVNALFCETFTPYEPLVPHRPQIAPTPAVEFLWASMEEPKESVEVRRQREAQWIARRLRGLLDEAPQIIWDEAAGAGEEPRTRRLRAGDVAILFRALTDVQYYEAALQEQDIEYYLVGGHAFYAQQEIFDLLNLLRCLESPADLVSLTGVLRSPFFNLSDETLLWLAQHDNGLREGLLCGELPEELDDQQRDRVRLAAETISELRGLKDRVPIARLIEEALARTGYDAALLADFLGERKLANLRKLIDQARSFDQSGLFVLSDYITELSEFVARQPKEPLAATQPETENVVRLMTIHQSKGLEFPLVVVPDLERGSGSSSSGAAFDASLGPLVRSSDWSKALTGVSMYSQQETHEDEEERLRLLYVAATRAADYLLLSSEVKELGTPGSDWTKLLAKRFDLISGQLREDVKLPPEYDRPTVRVTSQPPTLQSQGQKKPRANLQKVIEETLAAQKKKTAQVPSAVDAVQEDPAARRKFSFSRLSGKLYENHRAPIPVAADVESVVVPAQELDPRQLGTLVHAVLENVDFDGSSDIDALLALHAAEHIGEEPGELGEAREMITGFLGSARAKQLAESKKVYREIEFLLDWPQAPTPLERVYLRGFIDCLYQDAGGGWHLLDFKTNQIPTSLADVAQRYEVQMFVYALATERVLGQMPETIGLCFLRAGEEHLFSFEAPRQAELIESVNQAMLGCVQPAASAV